MDLFFKSKTLKNHLIFIRKNEFLKKHQYILYSKGKTILKASFFLTNYLCNRSKYFIKFMFIE